MSEVNLQKLVDQISKSPKYQHISVDLVRSIGRTELEKRKNLKEAVKATKNTLHQLAGAFFNSQPNYESWLEEIRQTSGNSIETRNLVSKMMSYHVSTHERLSILDDLYQAVFAELPEIQSVADLACGLNPLSVHWMRLSPHAEYYAYDIYADLMEFLTNALTIWGFKAKGFVWDVTDKIPDVKVDLAIALKAIPCLQNLDKEIVTKILYQLNCRYVLISFPSQSLTGFRKGMDRHYRDFLNEAVLSQTNWQVNNYVFTTEQFFLIDKGEK